MELAVIFTNYEHTDCYVFSKRPMVFVSRIKFHGNTLIV
jgi:hypothetical protein